MRILYCIQRYGREIAGGAEAACRELAEHMAGAGHDVEVLTTCALDYNTWEDHYVEGTTEVDGVTVHRVAVRSPRRTERFWPLHQRVALAGGAAAAAEHDWLRTLGPDAPAMVDWVREHGRRFDVAVCVTYMYATTGLLIRAVSEEVPVVLVPTAHDEPAFWLDVYRPEFDAASAVAFLTPEEQQLAQRRGMRVARPQVMGLGVDASVVGDGVAFRERFGIGDGPLVVYLGRLDPGKGPDELHRYMVQLWESGRTTARLAVVGQPIIELPEHPKLTVTGFVDETTKADALAAATVFAQPSYFESFSLSLCEAWVHRRPALVQRRCEVLRGQVGRSGGGLAYGGLGEFDAALARLIGDTALREQLGAAGRAYVEANYQWTTVTARHQALLEEVCDSRSASVVC